REAPASSVDLDAGPAARRDGVRLGLGAIWCNRRLVPSWCKCPPVVRTDVRRRSRSGRAPHWIRRHARASNRFAMRNLPLALLAPLLAACAATPVEVA